MNTIKISKELLINLGNYSNIKIVAEITESSERPYKEVWEELNKQIAEQEELEKTQRLAPKPQPSQKSITDPDIF